MEIFLAAALVAVSLLIRLGFGSVARPHARGDVHQQVFSPQGRAYYFRQRRHISWLALLTHNL